MEKILYFCPEGMPDTKVNDVENCRISTAFKNDNGEKIFLEVYSGYHHTFSGKKLLKSEDGFLTIEPGSCYYITDDPTIDDPNESRFLPVEEKLPILRYTKNDILRFVNEYCNCSFTKIEIVPSWLEGYDEYTPNKGYNLSNDYVKTDRVEALRKIYYEIAKKYFTNIYKKNIAEKKLNANNYKKELEYGFYSLKTIKDNTITIVSGCKDDLISDKERIKTFDVIY